ncbi:hypothetical protein ACFRQM_49490 [Streptomyces sp. NPDC056831]|uniref:SEL1-like repeat protein n=1 Tax=Streptomyces sp. NPDC056831 TaxID=3345954 RepID=UPI003677A795
MVVRGESCTGKTRTAFEAVRACLSDWQLVFPKDTASLLALLEANALRPHSILWLNDAQDFFLGESGARAAAALRRRLEEPGPTVVLATLWPEHHRTLTAEPPPSIPGYPAPDPHAQARALLGPLRPVDVPRKFTLPELDQLRNSSHPSLIVATASSPRGNITQTLAAGPQLVDFYEQAPGPHGVYGQAVITAAMDARRLGHTSPLPTHLLMAAAPAYLTDEQRAEATDTWFDEAIAFTRTKIKGVAAALERVAAPDGMGALRGVYRLADYLDHHSRRARRARRARRYQFPPGKFWSAVQAQAATAEDLRALAEAAQSAARYRIAATAYRQAADAGDAEALLGEARMREYMIGDVEGTVQLGLRAAAAGHPEESQYMAARRLRDGDHRSAERLFEQAAAAGDSISVLYLARMREQSGDSQNAERLYQQAIDAKGVLDFMSGERARIDFRGARLAERAAKAGHPRAWVALGFRCKYEDKDPGGAKKFYQIAAHLGSTDALLSLAIMTKDAGDPEGAERLARQAIDAGDTQALVFAAKLREEAGDREEAERLALQAADGQSNAALYEVLRRRAQAGNWEGVERLAQEVTKRGNGSGLSWLASLYKEAGQLQEAERFYRQAADLGHSDALGGMFLLYAESGDHEGMEQLARQAVGTKNVHTIDEFVRIYEMDVSDRGSAERLAQQAADFDEGGILFNLSRRRKGDGDPEGAARLRRQALDAGTAFALLDLALYSQKAGDTESAERFYRQAIDSGGHAGETAIKCLTQLWEKVGDYVRAERLRRFGLEADGSVAGPWW